ncbi:mediator of RNA polymerase II transcription subunit 10 isoform X2 [Accipiter gentilis]|uniref:mediator of RNA polymerase II transcription subunit 10 isoform X2 n=1 Tax=Astur gentilis TaxID=8957 RepID=UPI0021106E1E|nr:mediator of RNA polymerase II transcription subunit 10 isoform X2 [Accipiter gentilis]
MPHSSLCVEGLAQSIPAGRSEVGVPQLSWGSPPYEGAQGRCCHPLGTGQRGDKPAGESSWGTEPFRQNPPLSFHRWLGVTSRFISLSPLLPVSPSTSHEENSAWLIPLAAQLDVSWHRFVVVALSSAVTVRDRWKDSVVACKYKVHLRCVSAFFQSSATLLVHPHPLLAGRYEKLEGP